jgi:uncharacterized protein with von Willebrand factor type A (vWA) domain
VTDRGGVPDLLPAVDRAAFAAAFTARLRRAGLPVSMTAPAAVCEALATAPPGDVDDLYWLLRLTVVNDVQQLGTFDRVFDVVFRQSAIHLDGQASGPTGAEGVLASTVLVPETPAPGGGLPWHSLPRTARADDDEALDDAGALPERLPSALEAIADTPFEDLDEQQLALVGAWLERAWTQWPTRRSRRRRVHPAGRRVELRETLARSRRTGWETVELARSRPSRRPRPLTVLVDVSGSMQPYAAAYLHLMRALARSGRAETFAFSTSLTRLTPALRHRSATTAMAQATAEVVDRYGGTRLASSLRGLLASRQGNRLRGGVLVVASDGWDSEQPEEVAAALRRIRMRVHRLVWLNPRSATPGFEPLVGSMAAALPFCDDFLPAHTTRATVEALAEVLARSGEAS